MALNITPRHKQLFLRSNGSQSTLIFDYGASLVSALLQHEAVINEFGENMRYDAQATIYFRAAIVSMILICYIGFASTLSIGFQLLRCLLLRTSPSAKHKRNHWCDVLVMFLNITSVCTTDFVPLLYFAITWREFLLTGRGTYGSGFYLTLSYAIAICAFYIFF